MQVKKDYEISVIIPIYNVEDYLEETIQSIINQTIGFDKIQLILVNDGSPDNSEAICLKYKEMYPDNILYLPQENAGVSVARNNGLKHATGKYINFLDSDDTWDKDAFLNAYRMFKKNPKITSVMFPVVFFEASTAEYPLNYKYKKNCVIDIREDYEYIKLQSCTIMFKREIVCDHEFIKELKISEDCRFVTEILLENPYVGIVTNSKYNYRKRMAQTSAIQTAQTKRTWYIDTPTMCYQHITELSKKQYGYVLKYIQQILVYELHWRMLVPIADNINAEDRKFYLDTLRKILKDIDDKLIIDFSLMTMREKLYMLSFKYGSKDKFIVKNDKLYLNKAFVCESYELNAIIDSVNVSKDFIDIYGRLLMIPNVIDNIYLDVDGKRVDFDYYELDASNITEAVVDNEYQFLKKGIHARVNLKNSKKIKIMGENKKEHFLISPAFTYYSNLNNAFSSIYLRSDHYYLKYLRKIHAFRVYKKGVKNAVTLETKCFYQLMRLHKFKSLIYRLGGNLWRVFHHKKVWLVSDRIQVAGDNGEAFFEYLMARNDLKEKVYFVISNKAPVYEELKRKYPKNILEYGTFRHKMIYLNASKIISAQADDYVMNLFGHGKNYIGDLYRFQFIFLQHGIINNDLSPWLNVNAKKIDMFVTSSQLEYDSIVSGKYRYNYPKDIIKLTGLARYDKLKNNDETLDNTIVIMPTWRKYLVSNIDRKTGERIYDETFKDTIYFKFYNELLNNKKLLEVLRKNNYKIRFIPHANMLHQISDFEANDCVDIIDSNVNYAKEFKKNKVLITDYSSVFFDFSYLEKPIILTQFDFKEFFEGQIYDRGYFSYEKDGFGLVCDSVEKTVNEIISLIDNDCKLDEKYLKRIEKFYKYHDQKNCERIYNEIIKLDKKDE